MEGGGNLWRRIYEAKTKDPLALPAISSLMQVNNNKMHEQTQTHDIVTQMTLPSVSLHVAVTNHNVTSSVARQIDPDKAIKPTEMKLYLSVPISELVQLTVLP